MKQHKNYYYYILNKNTCQDKSKEKKIKKNQYFFGFRATKYKFHLYNIDENGQKQTHTVIQCGLIPPHPPPV